MSTQRFWKCIALLGIAALCYVGHGLHRTTTGKDLSLVGECFGQDHFRLPGGQGQPPFDVFMTCDSSGRELHFWTIEGKRKGVEVIDPDTLPWYVTSIRAEDHSIGVKPPPPAVRPRQGIRR